jgi:hypothetical protein
LEHFLCSLFELENGLGSFSFGRVPQTAHRFRIPSNGRHFVLGLNQLQTHRVQFLLNQTALFSFGQQAAVALGVDFPTMALELQLTLQHQHLP